MCRCLSELGSTVIFARARGLEGARRPKWRWAPWGGLIAPREKKKEKEKERKDGAKGQKNGGVRGGKEWVKTIRIQVLA